MQVTIRQLIDGWPAMQKLAGIEAGNGLTIKQAYTIGKISKIAEPELQRVESLKMGLFDKFGESLKDKDGKPALDQSGQPLIQIKTEHKDEYIRQMEEMFDTKVDIPVDPFPIDDLKDNIPLTAVDLTRLSWLIVGD